MARWMMGLVAVVLFSVGCGDTGNDSEQGAEAHVATATQELKTCINECPAPNYNGVAISCTSNFSCQAEGNFVNCDGQTILYCQPAPAPAPLSVSLRCSGENDGLAYCYADARGGSGPFEYTWYYYGCSVSGSGIVDQQGGWAEIFRDPYRCGSTFDTVEVVVRDSQGATAYSYVQLPNPNGGAY